MNRSILVCLMAAACGSATGTDKQGSALVTLHGQLTGASNAGTSGPVSLAIAWYPFLASNSPVSFPKAIVTQKVTFQGTFPVDFTLQLDGPPPDDALVDLAPGGGHGKAAYGTLIAFEDRNGNGQLDLIPSGGTPIDKIVGSSGGDPSLIIPQTTYSIQYLDGTAGGGDQLDILGGQQGYNLMKAHYWWGVERIPLDTSVNIPISGDAALDILVCPDEFSELAFAKACGVDPYDGGYQLTGNVTTFDAHSPVSIAVNIFDANGFNPNATLDFNGTPLPNTNDSNHLGYSLEGLTGTSGTLHVSVPGHPVESIPLTVMPPLTVSVQPGTFHAGSDVNASWQAIAGVELYDVTVSVTDVASQTGSRTLLHQLINTTQTTVAAVPSGTVTIGVTAVGNPVFGAANSYMQTVSRGATSVAVTP